MEKSVPRSSSSRGPRPRGEVRSSIVQLPGSPWRSPVLDRPAIIAVWLSPGRGLKGRPATRTGRHARDGGRATGARGAMIAAGARRATRPTREWMLRRGPRRCCAAQRALWITRMLRCGSRGCCTVDHAVVVPWITRRGSRGCCTAQHALAACSASTTARDGAGDLAGGVVCCATHCVCR